MATKSKRPVNGEDMFKYAAHLADCNPKVIKKYWGYILDAIIHVCHFDGECEVPGFCSVILERVDAKKYIIKDEEDGQFKEVTEPSYCKVKANPVDDFINDVNGFGVTHAYKMRVKKKKLNERDIQRMTKATMQEQMLRHLAEERMAESRKTREQGRAEFMALLEKRKKEHEERKNEQTGTDSTSDGAT